MATLNKFNDFTNQLTAAKHDFSAHAFRVVLSNTAPVATNAVIADIVQIATGAGYPATGNLLTTTRANNAGSEAILFADSVFTATAAMGPFRYVVVYNSTQATPVGPLVGFYDYGVSITLNATETFTVDFDNVAGAFTIA